MFSNFFFEKKCLLLKMQWKILNESTQATILFCILRMVFWMVRHMFKNEANCHNAQMLGSWLWHKLQSRTCQKIKKEILFITISFENPNGVELLQIRLLVWTCLKAEDVEVIQKTFTKEKKTEPNFIDKPFDWNCLSVTFTAIERQYLLLPTDELIINFMINTNSKHRKRYEFKIQNSFATTLRVRVQKKGENCLC